MAGMQDYSSLDTRQLMTGKDGKCFIEIEGKNYFLAEVDSFSVNMSVNNVDVQPVGSIIVGAVPTGVTFNITFSEMVIRDDLIMGPLIDAIKSGFVPSFIFQMSNQRPTDGSEQRITLRDCTPDGEFNLMNLVPGEVIKRNQSYRVNRVPEWLSKLAAPAA